MFKKTDTSTSSSFFLSLDFVLRTDSGELFEEGGAGSELADCWDRFWRKAKKHTTQPKQEALRQVLQDQITPKPTKTVITSLAGERKLHLNSNCLVNRLITRRLP